MAIVHEGDEREKRQAKRDELDAMSAGDRNDAIEQMSFSEKKGILTEEEKFEEQKEDYSAFVTMAGFGTLTSFIFLLIGTIGTATMYVPDEADTKYNEISMWRWHPRKDNQYYFGLHRMVGVVTDDDGNNDYEVIDYHECLDEGGSGMLSEEVCKRCAWAGDTVQSCFISGVCLFFILSCIIPFVIDNLPAGMVRNQMLYLVYLCDPTWDEEKARAGYIDPKRYLHYMIMNLNKGSAPHIFRNYHLVAPVILTAVISSGLGKFEICTNAIKDHLGDEDSMYDGAGRALLIVSAVYMGISVFYTMALLAISNEILQYQKKKIDQWRLEPVGGNETDRIKTNSQV